MLVGPLCPRLGEEPVGSQRAGANLTWWTIGQLDADDQYLISGINADVSFFNKRVPGRSWNQANRQIGTMWYTPENITPRVGDEPIVRDFGNGNPLPLIAKNRKPLIFLRPPKALAFSCNGVTPFGL